MPTVLALPSFDLATRSASGYLLRWIAPRLEPVHLLHALDTRRAFILSAPQSDIIIMTGHGSEDSITGQNEAVILEVGKYSPGEVKGKVIKLLACQCGVILAPNMVEKGASSVAAYSDDYLWIMDSDLAFTPWADKEFAGKFLMPVIDGLNALLDGKAAGEALQIELDGYTGNAEVEEDELVKSLLEFNRDNAVLSGNPEAKVRARPGLALPFRLIPPPPIILPIVA